MSEIASLELRFQANSENVEEEINKIIDLVSNMQSQIDNALGGVTIGSALADMVKEVESGMNGIKDSIKDAQVSSKTQLEELQKSLSNTAKGAQSSSTNTVSAINKIKSAMSTLGKFIGITSLIVGIKKLTSSMLNFATQTLNSTRLLNATFGDLADTVSLFGEGLNRAWGVSATAVNQNVASMYQLSKNLGIANKSALNMSKGITQLSYELANLYGKDQSAAFTALKNAINGQYRTLKKDYNIAIDETKLKSIALANGIIQEGQSLNSTTKAMAAYLAIVEQSQGAVGTMSSGTRNISTQLSILKAQLNDTGKYWSMAFAPIFTYVIPAISALINVLGRLGQYFASIMSRLFGFGNSWKDTANALAGGGSIGGSIADSMDEAEDSIGSTTSALKKMNKQLAGIDELNVLKKPEDTSGAGGGTISGGGGVSFEIPEMEMPEGDSEVKAWADRIQSFLQPAIDLFKSLGDTVGIVIGGIVNLFKAFWSNGGESLFNSLKNLWDAFMNLATAINESAIQPVLQFIATEIMPALGTAFGMVADAISVFVNWIADLVKRLSESETFMEALKIALATIATIAGGLIVVNVASWIYGIVTAVLSIVGLPAIIIAALVAFGVWLISWIVENWESIKEFIANIPVYLGEFFAAAGEFIKAAFEWVVETVLGLIGTVLEFIGGLFVSLLGLLVEGLAWIIDNVLGFISWVITSIADFVLMIGETIGNFIEWIVGIVVEFFANQIKAAAEFISNFIGAFIQMFKDIIQWIKDTVGKIVDKVIELKNKIVAKFNEIKQSIANIINGIKTTLSNIVNWVKTTFVNGFSTALSKIRGFFTSLFNALPNIIKAPFNGVIWLINKAIDGLNSIHVSIPSWVPGIGGYSFGLSLPKLPSLYTGGLAYGETVARVGDYANSNVNPEVISPLDKLSTMMIKSMETALINAKQLDQNEGNATYVIQTVLDGKVITQKVIKNIKQYEADTGKPVFSY